MRIAVVGTGTEIGKTHVTCAVVGQLRSQRKVVAMKPIESGGDADARALGAACGTYAAPCFAFADPVSPHLAARRESRRVNLDEAVGWVRGLELPEAWSFVETAGGLFSPLGDGITNASLVRALDVSAMILVAPDRLGVLHDITATLKAATLDRPTLIVLSSPTERDSSTGTNAAEITALGIGDVAAVFPRAPLDASETQAAAERLAQRLSELTNESC